MDIVTHGMMGMILASPFAESDPIAASCFAVGSVAPDLDALSRVFGKRAFLRAHQTYSHSIPLSLGFGGLAWAVLAAVGMRSVVPPLALVLGMLFHSALDVTNTYGIMLFAPFSKRRFCTEWVFFIDAVVLAVTVPTLIVLWRELSRGTVGWKLPAVYVAVMLVYWALKVVLRRQAARHSGAGTVSLLPSALVPWHFLGCAREGAAVRTFRLNVLTGAITDERRYDVYDTDWLPKIGHIPEFTSMRQLSPVFHVVEVAECAEGTLVTCRDLRTRNFDTRFGELNLVVDSEGSVSEMTFHV
jgi:membrane-bound metal-dependent hydrolase YbcI (DUF457 family)